MKTILAALVAVWASIFGGHQVATHSAPQAASAAVAVTSAAPTVALFPIESVTPSLATTTERSSSADATTTVVNNYITNPVVERVVDQQVTSSGISDSYLDTRLSALDQSLRQLISQTASASLFSGPVATTPINGAAFALSQKIDHLTGASLVDVTVDGVSGLTDADIPDNITASNYLPRTGGSLAFASSTLFSVFDGAYFGATATSSFDSTGFLTLPSGFLSTASSTIASGLFSANGGASTTNITASGTGYFASANVSGLTASQLVFTDTNKNLGSTGNSAAVAAAVSDETGTGSLVFSASPTFTGLAILANASTTNLYLPSTDGNSSIGVIYKGVTPFIHNYSDATSLGKNTFVGMGAGNFTMSPAGGANYLGALNTATGYLSFSSNTTGYGNSADGYNTLHANTTGYQNAAQGTEALHANTTGFQNSAHGTDALYSNTTGNQNSAQGFSSLYSNSSGYQNSAQGVFALRLNTTGYNNTAQGFNALYSNTTGVSNTAQGFQALYNNTAPSYSVAIGSTAGQGASAYSNVGGTYIGYAAGLSVATGSDYNTLFGYASGRGVTTGTRNVLLGQATIAPSYNQVTTGSNNIAIGNDVAVASSTLSNQLVIGNLIYGSGLSGTGATVSSGNVGIATTTPWRTLSVTGTVGFDGLTGNFGAGSLCLTANKEVVYNSGSDSCLSSLRSTKHDVQTLDVAAIDMVKSLQPVSFIYNSDASSTVRYGFIAEDTAAVDSHLGTYDQAGNISGVDDRSMLAIVVKALQSLIDTVGNFANSVTTKELTFTRATGDEIDVQKLCIGSTCVTEDQLKTLLANAGSAGASSNSTTSSGGSTDSTTPDASTTPDTTPPAITINGNNPAHINVGGTYSDLGASITDDTDQNLGLKYFLNGALVSTITVDTSTVATDTIDYVATDSAGNTATSTRTIIIDAALSTANSAGTATSSPVQ